MAKTENNKPVHDSAYYNELVKVHLFKDNDKYKNDVFVAVNGVSMMVPRGVDVEIPRKFAEVLRNSEIQNGYAAEYQLKLQEEAKKSALEG